MAARNQAGGANLSHGLAAGFEKKGDASLLAANDQLTLVDSPSVSRSFAFASLS
jgi:hypothetical protein